MSNQFRRPFKVEWFRRLYNGMGQTDPESQTFTCSDDAINFWSGKTWDGYDAHIYERDSKTGEWEY